MQFERVEYGNHPIFNGGSQNGKTDSVSSFVLFKFPSSLGQDGDNNFESNGFANYLLTVFPPNVSTFEK